ncbi:MAG: amidohydrolase family protein [Limisphaerales bacterium]
MKTLNPKLPSASRRRRIILAGALAGVFVWASLPARPYRPVEPIPAGIVDMHCHIAGIGAGGSGCFVSSRLRHNFRFKIYLRSYGVSEQELLQQGDSLVGDRISESLVQSKYVSRAVLLALDGVVGADGNLDTNRTEVYVPNEFVAEMAARHTNLLFGASVNPYRRDALARLEWAKAHGAVLVKWIPNIMAIDPSEPKLIPFYKKMAELKLPLLSHTGEEKSFSSANQELGDPDKLRLPLSLGVTVVAAHIASEGIYHGERGPDRLARMMGEYTNLYTDISALTQINRQGRLKEALTRPEFSGRLVYGTDYPPDQHIAGFAVVFVSPFLQAENRHLADEKSVGQGCFDEARFGRADGRFRAVGENVWRHKMNSCFASW